jgi:hypothetical protein
MRTLRLAALLLFCSTVFAQQPTPTVPGEPANIQTVAADQLPSYKFFLKKYHDCTKADCYWPQMDHQIDVALRYLHQEVASAGPDAHLAIVLDIDETSLSNWAVELHDDFTYVPADSNLCVAFWCGKAIPGTLRLAQQARKDHVEVFFVTGRPESQRADTVANLKAEGFYLADDAHLYLRPDNHPHCQSVPDYKSGARADIIAKQHKVILNVGDQISDLVEEPLGVHWVKLPNPFYFIPSAPPANCPTAP